MGIETLFAERDHLSYREFDGAVDISSVGGGIYTGSQCLPMLGWWYCYISGICTIRWLENNHSSPFECPSSVFRRFFFSVEISQMDGVDEGNVFSFLTSFLESATYL